MIRRKSDQKILPKSRFKVSGHTWANTRIFLYIRLPVALFYVSGGAGGLVRFPHRIATSFHIQSQLEHTMFKLCIERICFILNHKNGQNGDEPFIFKDCCRTIYILESYSPPPQIVVVSGGLMSNNDPFSLVLKILRRQNKRAGVK